MPGPKFCHDCGKGIPLGTGWKSDTHHWYHDGCPARLGIGEVRIEQLRSLETDTPFCLVCGHIMTRNGACLKCLNCGTKMSAN